MLPVIIIRPETGASDTLGAALELEFDAYAFPMITVHPCDWSPVDPAAVDALLIGSANAIRHGGPALNAYRHLPLYAVGAKTARVAREAGMNVVQSGKGGLQHVVMQLAPAHRRLLRLSGLERVPLRMPSGVTMTTRTVYAAKPLPMPNGLASMLNRPALVLLHSASAARHFGLQCHARGIARNNIHIAALGPRIAESAGKGWASVDSCAPPDDAALLALAGEICQGWDQGS